MFCQTKNSPSPVVEGGTAMSRWSSGDSIKAVKGDWSPQTDRGRSPLRSRNNVSETSDEKDTTEENCCKYVSFVYIA